MSEILKRHIELVEMVNSADSEYQHQRQETYLHGFREALRLMNVNQIMDCDYHYMDKGIDRPMCGGVFLDWKPAV